MSNIFVSSDFRSRWMDRVIMQTMALRQTIGSELLTIPEDVAPPTEEFTELMGSLVEESISSHITGQRDVRSSVATVGLSNAHTMGVSQLHVAPYIYLTGGEIFPSVPHKLVGFTDYGLAAYVFEKRFPVRINDHLWSNMGDGLRQRIHPVPSDLLRTVFLSTGGTGMMTFRMATTESLSALTGPGLGIIHPRMIEALRGTSLQVPYAYEIMQSAVYAPSIRFATTDEIGTLFRNLPIDSWLRTNLADGGDYFRGLNMLRAYEESIPLSETTSRPSEVRAGPSVQTTGVVRPTSTRTGRASRIIEDEIAMDPVATRQAFRSSSPGMTSTEAARQMEAYAAMAMMQTQAAPPVAFQRASNGTIQPPSN